MKDYYAIMPSHGLTHTPYPEPTVILNKYVQFAN